MPTRKKKPTKRTSVPRTSLPPSPALDPPAKVNLKELLDPVFDGPMAKFKAKDEKMLPKHLSELTADERKTYQLSITDIDDLNRLRHVDCDSLPSPIERPLPGANEACHHLLLGIGALFGLYYLKRRADGKKNAEAAADADEATAHKDLLAAALTPQTALSAAWLAERRADPKSTACHPILIYATSRDVIMREGTNLNPGNVEFLPVPPGYIITAPPPAIIRPAREPENVTSQAAENPRSLVDPAVMNAATSTFRTTAHGFKTLINDNPTEELMVLGVPV
ncbi:hypothetical protein N7486_006495 [Penicillium sp. IBT 16267x]|nr:hypothetical protein N7486_006495 [Penicillium sp. IBT 16267x]